MTGELDFSDVLRRMHVKFDEQPEATPEITISYLDFAALLDLIEMQDDTITSINEELDMFKSSITSDKVNDVPPIPLKHDLEEPLDPTED